MKLPTLDELMNAASDLKFEGISSTNILDNDLHLKLECLLPGNSYKMRGVRTFLRRNNKNISTIKVLSAGNLALALAMGCKDEKIKCQAIVPEGLSTKKKTLLLEAHAEVIEVPYSKLFDLVMKSPKDLDEDILHPLHSDLICGYGSIAIEILNDLKTCSGIVAPYGLGGLTLALAHTLKLLQVDIPVYAAEIFGHSPLHDSMEARRPISSPRLQSFIEAMGAPIVLDYVFNELSSLNIIPVLCTEDEAKREVKSLYLKHNLVLEGASCAAHASAVKISQKNNLAVLLTGGNISKEIHEAIIQ
jgi:threonine dehydratase